MKALSLKLKFFACLVLTSVCFGQGIPAENTAHQIIIKWLPPKSQVYDGFHIYRADTCHDFIYLKNVGLVRQYTDKAVVGGEVYRYKVRTVLNGIESEDSNVPSITVPLI